MNGEGGWKEDDSRLFASLGEVFTPGREEILRAILAHVPAKGDEPFLAVDVGCGPGWLSGAMLRDFAASRVLGLDGSPEMLRVAGELLSPFGERASVLHFRLEDPYWPDAIREPVRCFVSALVLHHLDGAGKRGLFRRLLEKLEPGGALLYADLVEPGSKLGRRHASRAWEQEVLQRSREFGGDERAYRAFIDQRWNWFEHPDPADKPSGVAEQLRWLADAGFEDVDLPWARAGHALFCAYRPAA